MLIFWLFFILADKISRFAKFWAPIQNLNSVAVWEIPYLNWRHDFVRFLRNFCQNAWTSSLCAHLKNDVFWISTVVLWTRKTKMSLYNYKFRLPYFPLWIDETSIGCGSYPLIRFNKNICAFRVCMTTVLIRKTPLSRCVQRLEVHGFWQKLCENVTKSYLQIR